MDVSSNVNEIYNSFIQNLNSIITTYSKAKITATKPQETPWYDREMEQLIKTKNYWYTPRNAETQQMNRSE